MGVDQLLFLWKVVQLIDGPVLLGVIILIYVQNKHEKLIKKATDAVNDGKTLIDEGIKLSKYKRLLPRFEESMDHIKVIKNNTDHAYRFIHALNKKDFFEKFDHLYMEICSTAAKVRALHKIIHARDQEGRPKIWFPISMVEAVDELNILMGRLLDAVNSIKK